MSNGGLPDFSRHPNVGQEKFVSKKQLFRAEPPEADNPWINLYDKIGGYYNWSWKQFYEETPYYAIKGLFKKISERIEKLEDGKSYLRWESVDVAVGISRALGGGSDDD